MGPTRRWNEKSGRVAASRGDCLPGTLLTFRWRARYVYLAASPCPGLAAGENTLLSESPRIPLQEHLRRVTANHERDVAEGWGRVQMPMALDRKYPNAPANFRWQWVFPQDRRWINPTTKEQGRHHVDASLVQKAVRDAVSRAGLTKRATCHTFRHSFATHLLEGGYDIRTVQELLGDNDVKTAMIYPHVLNRGPAGVRSPADGL